MSSITPDDEQRSRRRLTTTIKDTLRELTSQVSLLNHHVAARVDLRDVDLDCLDMISRDGPMSPSALARRTGLHPATMTGVLDRLQRAGWIIRERGAEGTDRRAVTVQTTRERSAEVYRLYGGMNTSLDEICAGYTDAELGVLADFLDRATRAGRTATEELASD